VNASRSVTLAALLGLRYGAFSADLEPFTTLSSSRDLATGGRVRVSLVGASLYPCGHLGVLYGCLGLGVGSLRAESEGVPSPRKDSGLHVKNPTDVEAKDVEAKCAKPGR
jgi:hypothetical protein